MSKQVNYNENLVAGAAIRDDKGRRISKLFEASHPKMTVGYAKNLIMPDTPTEQEFNFRQSGGGVIEDGVAVIDKVKGNSVVWNQLVKVNSTRCDDEGITSTLSSDGGVILNGVAANDGIVTVSFDTKQILPYHKVALYRDNLISKNEVQIPSSHIAGFGLSSNAAGDIFTGVAQGGTESVAWVKFKSGDSFTNDKIRIGIADLTQMFGAGNEPTTYEEFLSRKPKVADEYAYNEGTIVNNKVEKVRATGVNLWDEEYTINQKLIIETGEPYDIPNALLTSFIKVIPDIEVYVHVGISTDGDMCFYDANKKYIGYASQRNIGGLNKVVRIPSDCHYIRYCVETNYGPTYNHDICINLSDPAINGQYFPYEKHELDLSWVKEIKDGEGVKLFEAGMKSAGTAFDEVGKNKAVKRLGIKVFDGTEVWRGNDEIKYVYLANLIDIKSFGELICSSYKVALSFADMQNNDKTVAKIDGTQNNLWYIHDSSYSLDSWKAHLAELYAAGTPLVVYYELAEPIEVEYDEKNLTYPVVAGGTEEAIASEPSTAFRADIGYGIDAVKTILDLKARVEALEGK